MQGEENWPHTAERMAHRSQKHTGTGTLVISAKGRVYANFEYSSNSN